MHAQPTPNDQVHRGLAHLVLACSTGWLVVRKQHLSLVQDIRRVHQVLVDSLRVYQVLVDNLRVDNPRETQQVDNPRETQQVDNPREMQQVGSPQVGSLLNHKHNTW